MENQVINNLDYKARRVLVIGVSRTGKSTLMARLIATHPAELVLIYDWQGGEFATRLGGTRAWTRDELREKIEQGHRVICYMAESAENDPKGEGFEWFCAMCFEVGGSTPGRKLMVVDECQDLVDPYNIPDSLGDVLSRGGRRMIDTCLAGRSANALQTEARDQVSELFVFRLVDGNSIKYPASLDIDPQRIKSLKDTHFIFKDMRTGDQKELALYNKKSNPEES